MTYLVDAFNVIHGEPRLKRLLEVEGPAPACRALVQLLVAWLSIPRRKRPTVVVVVDGARPLDAGRPGRGPVPGMTVVYMHDEADAELMRRLRNGRGRDVLVSADREIRKVAEATGSEAVAPRTFLRTVWEELEDEREHAERHGRVPPGEVQAWVHLFGGEKASATPPPLAPPPAAKASPAPKQAAPPPAAKRQDPPPVAGREGGLSKDEVKAWLAYFDRPPEKP